MKKFFEGLKDFLYDSVDYIIILGIVGIVVIIIGWRIDLLFDKDIPDKDKQVINNTIDKDTEQKDIEEDNIGHIEDTEDATDEENTDVDNSTEETPDKEETVVTKSNTIKISIPAGSLPSKIGSILEDKGLILSKNDFVLKTQELKLDTKLKSGEFNISTDSSLEDIIYLISK